MNVFWPSLQARQTLLVYLIQPCSSSYFANSNWDYPMLTIGFAAFSTCQVPGYSSSLPGAAAATEIAGRLLIQIKSCVEAQCMKLHMFSCFWPSCFLELTFLKEYRKRCKGSSIQYFDCYKNKYTHTIKGWQHFYFGCQKLEHSDLQTDGVGSNKIFSYFYLGGGVYSVSQVSALLD